MLIRSRPSSDARYHQHQYIDERIFKKEIIIFFLRETIILKRENILIRQK